MFGAMASKTSAAVEIKRLKAELRRCAEQINDRLKYAEKMTPCELDVLIKEKEKLTLLFEKLARGPVGAGAEAQNFWQLYFPGRDWARRRSLMFNFSGQPRSYREMGLPDPPECFD